MAEFWDGYLWPGIIIVGQILLIIVPIKGGVAYLTLAERKVIAAMQLRKGPNVVGPFGLFQPVVNIVLSKFAKVLEIILNLNVLTITGSMTLTGVF